MELKVKRISEIIQRKGMALNLVGEVEWRGAIIVIDMEDKLLFDVKPNSFELYFLTFYYSKNNSNIPIRLKTGNKKLRSFNTIKPIEWSIPISLFDNKDTCTLISDLVLSYIEGFSYAKRVLL